MSMNIAIVGGGIAGLSFALGLHQRGIDCDVFESVPEVKEIGVGITLLPHGMRELAALGVQEALEAAGIENLESVFYTQHGSMFTKKHVVAMQVTPCQKLAFTAASCTEFCLMRRSAG